MRVAVTGMVNETGADEPDELMRLLASWKRSVRAQRISPAMIDGDEVISLVLQHYEEMEPGYKSVLPMKRI